MPAYMVSRSHILYLVAAMRYYSILRDGDKEVAQLLWDENRKSIEYRYPDTINHPKNIPGQIGEDFIIRSTDLTRSFKTIEPLQVLMSCNCYCYRSCEHEEWQTSRAKRIIDNLKAEVIRQLPGYKDCIWGSPEPEDT